MLLASSPLLHKFKSQGFILLMAGQRECLLLSKGISLILKKSEHTIWSSKRGSNIKHGICFYHFTEVCPDECFKSRKLNEEGMVFICRSFILISIILPCDKFIMSPKLSRLRTMTCGEYLVFSRSEKLNFFGEKKFS